MPSTPSTIDWQAWLRRWDAMQTGYLPFREERFTLLLDVAGVLLGERFVALDLACGPGAISQRLLARFPQASAIALDYDPVLLALGRGALGEQGERLRWVEADLRDPGWAALVGTSQVDCVLSTTALHWLAAPDLVRLYQQLATLIRPGGTLLNGDHQRIDQCLPTFARVTAAVKERRRAAAFAEAGRETWRQWWNAIGHEPELAGLLAERERRFPVPAADDRAPLLALHEAALRDAGFAEVGLIWSQFDDSMLMAVR